MSYLFIKKKWKLNSVFVYDKWDWYRSHFGSRLLCCSPVSVALLHSKCRRGSMCPWRSPSPQTSMPAWLTLPQTSRYPMPAWLTLLQPSRLQMLVWPTLQQPSCLQRLLLCPCLLFLLPSRHQGRSQVSPRAWLATTSVLFRQKCMWTRLTRPGVWTGLSARRGRKWLWAFIPATSRMTTARALLGWRSVIATLSTLSVTPSAAARV